MKEQKKYRQILFLAGAIAVLMSGCMGKPAQILLEDAKSTDATNATTPITASDPSPETERMPSGSAGMSPDQADMSQEAADGLQDAADLQWSAEQEDAQTCYVYVCGAVLSPGVYAVDTGMRLCDVLAYAGGLCEDAEETSFNQATPVYDGMMLIVPTAQEWAEGVYVTGEQGLPVRANGSWSDDEREEASSEVGLLDINRATAEQLCTLPGVGVVKAESIITYRQEHGAFRSIEEITHVAGIKGAVYEKIKNKIRV